MGDECEEVEMILRAARTAQTRRTDDVRRRLGQQGEDKTTQTETEPDIVSHPPQTDKGITLLSYMAFSLVVGTLCQLKLFFNAELEHPYHIYIAACMILTLVLQCAIAYILFYISKRGPSESDVTLTLTFHLTVLIVCVTFLNMAAFILT